jgi:hypothetical protein
MLSEDIRRSNVFITETGYSYDKESGCRLAVQEKDLPLNSYIISCKLVSLRDLKSSYYQHSHFLDLRNAENKICVFVQPVNFNAMLCKDVTITVLDIIYPSVLYFKTRRFGDWILAPSSGGTYSNGPSRRN